MDPEFWNNTPVLITGGGGFLGSHLVEVLITKGARVSVLDNLEDPWRLGQAIDDITYIKADVTEWDGNSERANEFEVVFHLAALSTPSVAEQQAAMAYHINVMGMANILRVAQGFPLRKFIFTSAAAVYTNEPKYLPMDEKHPIDPSQSVYVMTKRLGELLCEDFRATYDMPTLYFRLFNTFGDRQTTQLLIPSFIDEARRQGKISVRQPKVRRDFNYVDDVINALIKGAESDFCGGPINIGTGVELSVGEIAEKIGVNLEVDVEFLNQKTFGPVQQVCDNTLAKRVLDWEPNNSFDQGLELTLGWYADDWPKNVIRCV